MKKLFILFLVLGFLDTASATISTYENRSLFLSGTGATAATPLPYLGSSVNSYTVGRLTYSGYGLGFGRPVEWSTLLPGNDIGISGLENLDVTVDEMVYAIGYEFHEPSQALGGNPNSTGTSVPIDSTFQIDIFRDSELLGSVQYMPPDDTRAFFGIVSDQSFNRISITEIVGGSENEYYGQFYFSTVPEPATLFLLGLGGLALMKKH